MLNCRRRKRALLSTTSDGRQRTYGISMFHQLHCLQLMRLELQAARNQSRAKVSSHHRGHNHNSMGEEEDFHVLHCFDYLRQAVLFNADGSFVKSIRVGEAVVIQGKDIHQCRDRAALYELSRKSETSDSQTTPSADE
ncbi:hypothetical protein F5Y15DRAFT_382414 [Xylariaceae sp. FL0016]|nr:hypothetical protein F5Y15DRAFT_382414 [Xylariaceae sp. FL0016]